MRARVIAVATVGVASAMAVGAKVPMVTIAAPVVAFLLWQVVRRHLAPGRRARRPRRDDRGVRLVALAAAALVGLTGVATLHDNPREFEIINATDTLFAGVLAASDDPAADLQTMGLPRALARYAGSSWWDDVPPQNDPAFTAAKEGISYATIGRFLASHPLVALDVADVGAKAFLGARPTYLGSYQASDAEPRARECRVCVVSSLTSKFQGLGILLWASVSLSLAAAAWWLTTRRRRGSTPRALAAASLLLNAICAVQFLTAAFGEGIETAKHMVIALLSGLLAALLLAMSLSGPAEERESAGPRA